jgi:hypothetical protein
MIEEGLVLLVSNTLKSEDAEVREQSAKLLSQFALSAIARQDFDHAFEYMRDLLEDSDLQVRT